MAKKQKPITKQLLSLFWIMIILIYSFSLFISLIEPAEKIENKKLVEPDVKENKVVGSVSSYIFGPKTYKVYIANLPNGADENTLEIVIKAMNFWEEIEDIDFQITNSEIEADLKVFWVKDFGGEHMGYAYRDLIEIGIGDSSCGEWLLYNNDHILQITKHEFGHALGYDHSDDTNSLMYPILNQEYSFIINKRDVLPPGYYQYFNACSLNDVADFSIDLSTDKEIDFYIVPSYEDFKNLLNEDSFLHYETCSKNEIIRYENNCIINNDGGFVIGNPSHYETVNYSINIKENY
jgi:hypothetical protein